MRRKPNQYALHFNEKITRTHFFLSQPSIRPVSAQVIYCGMDRQNFASNVTLYPCERSRQNHLVYYNFIFQFLLGLLLQNTKSEEQVFLHYN